MSIKQLLAAGNIDGLLVLITLLYAAGFVVIRYILTRRSLNIGLGDHMGGEKWDFSSSWASTLTAVGAILGTTLTAQVLPTQPQIPKSVFVSLNLLFGVIIVVAALVYSATRRPKAVDTKAGVGSGSIGLLTSRLSVTWRDRNS
jgi:preprotein translocase subunit SecG